jgi:RNA 2',3'-cyclic 3'-phosphodiesterase
VRLFVALEIPSAVREKLAALIEELQAAGSKSAQSKMRPRWVPAENLHLTLKFIGHVEEERVAGIRSELMQVRSAAAVDLRFRRLGFFPNDKRPRVLWAGVEASSNLAALAGEIDARIEKFGVARETREFAPHLTLARFDPPGISDELRRAVQAHIPREFGAARGNEFYLFESKTRPSGAEYTRLANFMFAKPED